MRIRIFHITGLLILTLVGAGAMASSAQSGQSQESQAVVRAVPLSTNVSPSANKTDLAIEVENVSNLAGFQFILAFDSDVLGVLSVDRTSFLSQTGREMDCPDPVIQGGVVRFACVTLRPTPAGVDGTGTIATVSLKPLRSGRSSFTLSKVLLVHPDGSVLPSVVVDGELTITRTGFFTRGRVLAISGGAVALIGVVLAALWRLRSSRRHLSSGAESGNGVRSADA